MASNHKRELDRREQVSSLDITLSVTSNASEELFTDPLEKK